MLKYVKAFNVHVFLPVKMYDNGCYVTNSLAAAIRESVRALYTLNSLSLPSPFILPTSRLYLRLHYIAVYCKPLPVNVYRIHHMLLTFRLYFRLHYLAVYCIFLPVKVYLLHLNLFTFRL